MNEQRTSADTITLAVLGERMDQVMQSIGDIKHELEQMPTRREMEAFVLRADHSLVVNGLNTRIRDLEKKVEAHSPYSLMQVIQQIAITVSALGAALALLYQVFRH